MCECKNAPREEDIPTHLCAPMQKFLKQGLTEANLEDLMIYFPLGTDKWLLRAVQDEIWETAVEIKINVCPFCGEELKPHKFL